MFSRFIMLGVSHRLATIVFLVLVTCITGFGLPRLSVDTGFNSLISDTDPDKPIYDWIAREFAYVTVQGVGIADVVSNHNVGTPEIMADVTFKIPAMEEEQVLGD